MRSEKIEVLRTAEDGLSRRRWEFWVRFPDLVVEEYAEEERRTKRHKWRPVRLYARLGFGSFYERALQTVTLREVLEGLPRAVASQVRTEAQAKLAIRVPLVAFDGMTAGDLHDLSARIFGRVGRGIL